MNEVLIGNRSVAIASLLFVAAAVGCTQAPEPNAEIRQRDVLADSVVSMLEQDVLDPWYPASVDTLDGGFLSEFAFDWELVGRQDKMVVTQARHVWTTARAAEFFPEQRDAYLAMSRQGVDFLMDKMWDRERGGFYSFVSRDGTVLRGTDVFTSGKTAYGNAFAIYGLAAYARAADSDEVLDHAKVAFRWLDEHAHDSTYGGYYQFFSRDGTPERSGRGTDPAKDQNSSIHILEALTELYQVWPDATVRERLEEMLHIVRDTIRTDPGYLQLFFTEDWTPISYRDSSEAVRRENVNYDHVSFGHDVETAYLMFEAAETLGIGKEQTLRAGKQMVDHALAHGYDRDTGGLLDGAYYVDLDAAPEIVLPEKTWWSQAEAMNAFLLFADQYPDDPHDYYARFVEMWRYINRYVVDHQNRGWYWGGIDVEPDRVTFLKGSIWKGSYHDGRALMNVAERLREVASE